MYEDSEFNADDELKRADHMIYVTLKYTRTADVIQNIIKRLTNAYEFSILETLNKLNKEIETKYVRRTLLNKFICL